MNSNFTTTTLGELAEITSSKRIFANEYVGMGIPFFRGKEITEKSNGKLTITTELFIEEEKYNEINRKHGVPIKGDILLTSVGTLGNTYQVQQDDKFYFKDGNITWFRRFSRNVDSSYILYWLRSPEGQSVLVASAIGTTQKALTISTLKSISINLPALQTQKAISKLCKSLDDRITLLRETNATLEAIAQALFKSWFVDFDPVRAKAEGREPEGMPAEVADLFPSEFEDTELGEMPKGWSFGTLADLATFQNGYAFKTQSWQETGHPVVKIGNVKPGIIDIDGTSYISSETTIGLDRFKLKRGDLLVGMTGYVGETGLMPEVNIPAYLNQRVGRISTNGIDDIGFVYCLVRNAKYKSFAEAQSKGSAQANVSGVELMSYAVVLPSHSPMKLFNKISHEIIDKILSNYSQSQTLTDLRDTLLPRLMSGKLRIPDLEEQAA